MKVDIGKPKSWFGPYQLAEALCFWVKEKPDEFGIPTKPDWVHKFGELLAHGSIRPEPKVGEIRTLDEERKKTLLYRLLLAIDSRKRVKRYVRIDPWDTWSADYTLGLIILPMLKQIKEKQRGAPFTNDEDVPEHLRSTAAEPKENDYDTDSNHFERWNYILDEIIFAFECKVGKHKNWESQFRSGEHDLQWKQLENGMSEMVRGPNDTYQCDYEGMKEFQKRIDNGFRLFGVYYESLWD